MATTPVPVSSPHGSATAGTELAESPLEIACDESGSEGDHLIGAETTVFAYASVRLDTASAAACVQKLRDRIGSPAQEYKAGHLLRQKSRPALVWLLGPSGPIRDRAHVHLTDKALFVTINLVGLFLDDAVGTDHGSWPSPAASAMAATLYQEGPSTWGPGPWHALLKSFNSLMQVRKRHQAPESAAALRGTIDAMHAAGAPGRLGEIIELLRLATPRVDVLVARLLDSPDTVAPLDPLIPAFHRTVAHWSAGGRPVSIVHDQQPALTGERVGGVGGRLAGLTFVDSRTDPRVQVADFVAGVARKVASDVLDDRADTELVRLLLPYVDPGSIWGGDGGGRWAAAAQQTR